MSADKNMTGEQIQQIMDMFLYKALEPLVLYTSLFDAQVEYLLYMITTNRKRKLSSLKREDVVAKLAAYLSVPDRRQKFEFIKEARLERSFVHRFIKNFLTDNMPYIKSYRAFLTDPSREHQVRLDKQATLCGRCSRFDLYNTLVIASAYLEKFYEYRNSVVDHYVKNSNKIAKAHVSMSRSNTSYKDLVQTIFRSIIVALDKYDYRLGALTSYIAIWAKNATTTTKEHEYGIAYTVPQAQRKKLFEGTSTDVNYGVSLDSVFSDDEDDNTAGLYSVLSPNNALAENLENEESISIVQKLIKKVDQHGIARLCLDIGEHFTKQEKELMRQHMREEGLA